MPLKSATGEITKTPPVLVPPVAKPTEDQKLELTIANLGTFKRLSRAFTRGKLTFEAGTLGFEVMQGAPPEVAEQEKKISARINELGDDGPGFVGWLGSAAEIAGQQYAQMTAPFGELKEAAESFAEPSGNALQKLGRAAGAVQQLTSPAIPAVMGAFKVEAGSSYVESIEAGVDPDTAKLTAFTVGTINAGLETAGLIGAGAPLAKATGQFLRTAVREAAASPEVLKAAGRVASAYGVSIGSEVSTELMQESVTIAATELGKVLSPEQLEAMSADEITDRLAGVMVKTFKGMTVLAMPGAAAQFGVEVQRARGAKVTAQALEEVKAVLDEAPDPVVAGEQLATTLDEANVKDFYIPADAMVEAAVKSGDTAAFYGLLGVQNQIEEAALLGGDVRIDARAFVAAMQGDNWDNLKDHIRFDPDDSTAAEAAEFEESGLDEEIAQLETEEGTITAQFTPEEQTEAIENANKAGPVWLSPVPEGHVRFFHGGQEPTSGGGRWVTPDFVYARDFRRVGGPNEVHFVDIPMGDPAEMAGRSWDEIDEVSGTNAVGRYHSMEIPEDWAKQFKPVKPEKKAPEEQAQLDEEKIGLQGFFKNAKDAGMTDAQYETYLSTLQRAADSRNAAQERIRLRKEASNNREEIKAKRAELEETARETVDVQPVYAALNALEGRERLNRDKLVGLSVDLDSLPKVKGRQIYEKGGKIDPAEFAEIYGFEAADIMLFSMIDAKPRAEAIKLETDRLFNERYVGLTAKQQELDAAIEALHNDSQAAVLALELNALREAVGQKKLKPRLLKIAAKDRLRDFPLKEINPKRYLAAERREARTAAKLLRKGDRLGASKAKFRELLNFQFAMEAYRIKEKTKTQHRYLKKFLRKPKQGAALPIDYLVAIRGMMGEVDLRGRPPLKDFIKEKEIAEGIVLRIPMRIQEDNGKTNYLNLTLRDWESLVDAVKETEKKGKDENKFLREQKNETRDALAEEVAANVKANLKQMELEEGTRWQDAKRMGRSLALLTTNTDSLVREIDGYKALGAAHNAIKKPYNQAMTTGYLPGQIGVIARLKKESQRLTELVGVIPKKERLSMKKRIVIPGLGKKMWRERMIMVLMNLGNLENRKALVDSGQFTEAELDVISNYASKENWDFVQSIWDYFQEFWPEGIESSKRRRNVIPTKVEATPIETPHGTYRGGYFPLMYEHDEVVMTRNAEETDISKLLETMRTGGYVQSQTKHGHLEDRRGNAKRSVKLELFNINAHLNQTVYDLEAGDAVMDIFKILRHPTVRGAFKGVGQQVRWDQLNLWFGDIVLGEQHFQDGWSRMWRHLRTGFVISKIGFNLTTIALQPLGLVNTMTQVGKQNTLVALMTAGFNPNAWRFVANATPFMQQRAATYNHDIIAAQQAFKSSMLKKWTPGNSVEVAGRWSFYGLIKMQMWVDSVTWMAAQRQGLTLFNGDVKKAMEHADNMVARAQSSGIFGYRTPLERGTVSKRSQQSELTKLFVPLMSYYLAKANVAYERIRRTNPRSPLEVIDTAIDLTIMTLGEAVLGSLILGTFPDDEDDLLGFLGWQWIKSMAAMVPGARDLAGEAEGFRGGGIPAYVFGEAGAFFKQASQGEIDAAFAKTGMRITGTLARIPGTSQAIKVFGAAAEESENPLDYVRGVPRQ